MSYNVRVYEKLRSERGGIICAEHDRLSERAIWVRHLILFLFFRNNFQFKDTCKNYCGGDYI